MGMRFGQFLAARCYFHGRVVSLVVHPDPPCDRGREDYPPAASTTVIDALLPVVVRAIRPNTQSRPRMAARAGRHHPLRPRAA